VKREGGFREICTARERKIRPSAAHAEAIDTFTLRQDSPQARRQESPQAGFPP